MFALSHLCGHASGTHDQWTSLAVFRWTPFFCNTFATCPPFFKALNCHLLGGSGSTLHSEQYGTPFCHTLQENGPQVTQWRNRTGTGTTERPRRSAGGEGACSRAAHTDAVAARNKSTGGVVAGNQAGVRSSTTAKCKGRRPDMHMVGMPGQGEGREGRRGSVAARRGGGWNREALTPQWCGALQRPWWDVYQQPGRKHAD